MANDNSARTGYVVIAIFLIGMLAFFIGIALFTPSGFKTIQISPKLFIGPINATMAATCPLGGVAPCWNVSLQVTGWSSVPSTIVQIQLNDTPCDEAESVTCPSLPYVPFLNWPISYTSNVSSGVGYITASTMSVTVKEGQAFMFQFYLDSSGAAVGGEKFASGQDVEIHLLTSDGDYFANEFALP